MCVGVNASSLRDYIEPMRDEVSYRTLRSMRYYPHGSCSDVSTITLGYFAPAVTTSASIYMRRAYNSSFRKGIVAKTRIFFLILRVYSEIKDVSYEYCVKKRPEKGQNKSKRFI